MSRDTYFGILSDETSRRHTIQSVTMAEDGMEIEIRDKKRTSEQNRLLWPILDLWRKNQTACVNGQKVKITREAWKCILLASFRSSQNQVPQLALGLHGELVPLGYETRNMRKPEFAEFLTWLLAETGEHGMELPIHVCHDYDAYLGRVA